MNGELSAEPRLHAAFEAHGLRASLATDVLRGLAVRSLTGGKIEGGVEAVGAIAAMAEKPRNARNLTKSKKPTEDRNSLFLNHR